MLCCALAAKSGDLIDGYNSVLGARQLRGAVRGLQTWEETNTFLQSAAQELTETGKNICECPQDSASASPVIDGRVLRSWNQRIHGRVLVKQKSTKQPTAVTNTPL